MRHKSRNYRVTQARRTVAVRLGALIERRTVRAARLTADLLRALVFQRAAPGKAASELAPATTAGRQPSEQPSTRRRSLLRRRESQVTTKRSKFAANYKFQHPPAQKSGAEFARARDVPPLPVSIYGRAPLPALPGCGFYRVRNHTCALSNGSSNDLPRAGLMSPRAKDNPAAAHSICSRVEQI